MTALEICLLLIGMMSIIISYFISDKNEEERLNKAADKLVTSEEMRQIVRQQIHEMVGNFLENITDEIVDKTERQLEMLSNEKIMALHDYSETVLGEVDKNHKEVMFLYSMLDDKEKEMKEAVVDVQNTVKSLRKAGNVLVEGITAENRVTEKKATEVKDVIEETTKEIVAEMAAMKESEKQIEINPIEKDETIIKETNQEVQEKISLKETKETNHDIILRMNKEGKSNLEIAKELGLGVGEVKLVVDLFHEEMP